MGRDIHYCKCGEEIFGEMELCGICALVPNVWCAMCGQWGFHKSGYCPTHYAELVVTGQLPFTKEGVLKEVGRMIEVAFQDGTREERARR